MLLAHGVDLTLALSAAWTVPVLFGSSADRNSGKLWRFQRLRLLDGNEGEGTGAELARVVWFLLHHGASLRRFMMGESKGRRGGVLKITHTTEANASKEQPTQVPVLQIQEEW